ncbi:SDR family oxidoreductase [Pseudomonas sp. SK]|uniref:UDP-glucose 4-epimerase family protein n=1 Tax=Pseudomonas sp. SK TaxID=2729423 RepID=UPI001463C51A|nr:SDR family oxidoreductase [Pseudomonas sp. SK]QJQ19689.1 SDR family oxidoreductase [Pseudomonas sp. SK]
MRVLITGASGFVGSAVLRRLSEEGIPVRGIYRKRPMHSVPGDVCLSPGLSSDSCWHDLLEDVSVVVHAAARVHVMKDLAQDPLTEFRTVNVDGTLALARQAAAAGVKRFVFISSIKVNGEETVVGHSFTAESQPAPVDPYGISKYEAELGLKKIADETGLEVVIIRPVLVYGPGVKGNFLSMMKWLDRGVPLPFGAINNKRSLIFLDNLVDLIFTCLVHPAAAGQVFLASDGHDLSTSSLLRRLSSALGRPARLLPIPSALIEVFARLIKRRSIALRLCGSLQVDIKKNQRLLDWHPPVSVDDGLASVATYYKELEK